MSIFAKPTLAPKPRSKDASRIAFFYAFIVLVMAVTQLFTFDSFLELIVSFGLPLGDQFSYFIGAFIVTVEVFALPFLLRMSLSKAFRWVSMICGWVVALMWLQLTTWVVITARPVDTIGFLGTLVGLIPGWWAVFASIALVILASWASWGLWPGKRKK